MALRLSNPLPRHLQDHQTATFLGVVTKKRDLAMFILMLRFGLRVEEVANLTLGAIDYGCNQIMVKCGKCAKDRIVFINIAAAEALAAYFYRHDRQRSSRESFWSKKAGIRANPYPCEASRRGSSTIQESVVSRCNVTSSVTQWRRRCSTPVLTWQPSSTCLVIERSRQSCAMHDSQTKRLEKIITWR